MAIIFVNVSNLNTINYDSDEDSWVNTPRVSGLGHLNDQNKKLKVCLYGLRSVALTEKHVIALLKLSGWADLYTLNDRFSMKEGFFPIMFSDDNTFFFTDKKEYSLLNGDWALDNVYKVDWHDTPPTFNPYTPQIPRGWQQEIIEAQKMRAGDLFSKVSNSISTIKDFCQNNQNTQVEITYSDRYVKTELALVICLQFIENLKSVLNPSTYRVTFIGEKFSDPRANSEEYRRLTDSFICDGKRDEIGKQLIADDNYTFESKDKTEIPHYRELMVKAGNNVMRIMPDAGLAHWGLDVQRCQADRQFYGTNNGVNSRIPICSSTEQVYYVSLG